MNLNVNDEQQSSCLRKTDDGLSRFVVPAGIDNDQEGIE